MNFFTRCLIGAVVGGLCGVAILRYQANQAEMQARVDRVTPSVLEQIAHDDIRRYQSEGVK